MRLFLLFYNLVWLLALPFLKRSRRTSSGWRQRTMQESVDTTFDLWIQAASGGESQLTAMILKQLDTLLPENRHVKILVTSGTQQGIDTLRKSIDTIQSTKLYISASYFPFDAPRFMSCAFDLYSPRIAVIVETELWPGFLVNAHSRNIPVLLINGRMSEKSFRSYRHFHRFFRKYGPRKIWAISELDCSRFAQVAGPEKVSLMHNIKFDRIKTAQAGTADGPVGALLPTDVPFILLGSIRREEEEKIAFTIEKLTSEKPEIVIGLFPKHLERASLWLSILQRHGIPCCTRSALQRPAEPGSVIVWDVYGELAGAYALAKTAFVGGSLINLGGQNFLEPLVFGLKPVIGPYWQNFAWVSRDILAKGLVHEVQDEHELCSKLLDELETEEAREEVIKQVDDYFSPRKGGTNFISKEILTFLS